MNRRQVVIIAGSLLVIAAIAFGWGLTSQMDVRILDQNKEVHLVTTSKDMVAALALAGIELNPSDRILPSLDTPLEDQMDIQIIRADLITVKDGTEEMALETTRTKVADILEEMGLVINPSDQVYPSLNAQIGADRSIEILRMEEAIEVVEEVVAQAMVVKSTSSLSPGDLQVKTEGTPGMVEVTYRMVYENGKLIRKEPIATTIATEAVSGTADRGHEKLLVTDSGQPIRYKAVHYMSATAYDLSYASCGKYPDHPAYGITFSGTHARPGVVAVDPKVIKLKSGLYVESLDRWPDYGYAKAEDTGSAIKGNKIDLFMHSNKLAFRFGRRNVRVYELLDPVTEEMMVGFSGL